MCIILCVTSRESRIGRLRYTYIEIWSAKYMHSFVGNLSGKLYKKSEKYEYIAI